MEGTRGLYRGFLVTAAGSAPGTCLYLTSYEVWDRTIDFGPELTTILKQSKKYLMELNGCNEYLFLAHFGAGMMAETISCVFWVPIDVVKERLQVQSTYRNATDAFRHILQLEGIKGIYKGYGATLLSFGPFSAFYFLFYEKTKQISTTWCQTQTLDDVPFWMLLTSSAIAGAGASLLTNPLDLVKLRLQIQRRTCERHTPSTSYTGVWDGLGQTVRSEGIPGLFKGAGARMAFHAPSTALTIALFERYSSFINRWIN